MMQRLERKDDATFRGEKGLPVALELKVTDTDSAGEFEGYGSVFGQVDHGMDIVMKGAFMGSLRTRPFNRVKLLYQHDPSQLLGKFNEIREDDRGLFVVGKLNKAVAKAQEVHALMLDGALDSMSIGYRTKRDEIDRDAGTRKLIEVDLMEISIVTFPMNEGAMINAVKAGALPSIRDFQKMLMRDAGFSRSQAEAIIATGYKSLTTMRDAGRTDESDIAAALAEARRAFSG